MGLPIFPECLDVMILRTASKLVSPASRSVAQESSPANQMSPWKMVEVGEKQDEWTRVCHIL